MLQGERIHLNHHAVDLVRKVGALLQALLAEAVHLGTGFAQFHVGIHMEAAATKPLKQLPLPRCLDGAIARNGVDEGGKLALGSDIRVFLAQRAGRGVARVGEGLVALRAFPLVQRLEAGLRHVDLAADLDGLDALIDIRQPFVHQAQGDVVNRAHIHGNVFARGAVAACGGLHQAAVLVGQRQR